MTTTRKTITLTEDQNTWVKTRVKEGGYTNDSEFFRDLIRKDRERAEKIAHMQRLIDEAFESGVSDKTPEDVRTEVQNRLIKNGQLPLAG